MAKLKSFEFFLNKLLKGFRSVEKREPNNLEMILIKQEAGNKARDAAKVIEVDFGKPFKQEMEDIKGRMSGIKSLSDELEKMSKGYDEYYGTGTSQKYKEKDNPNSISFSPSSIFLSILSYHNFISLYYFCNFSMQRQELLE